VARIYLPPDANCLLAMADHCLRSRDYVNLIVIDKQPQLQYLDIDAAREHCARGLSIWDWASSPDGHDEPDIVLGSAGDIPTMEVVAAAWLLRQHAPSLKVRVVNVVDLMCLYPRIIHPHGLEESRFVELFTAAKPVVFGFHGYQRAIHAIIHGRTNAERFHVRGFMEEGTTTTPFDMVVRNEVSRYHLCMEALRRSGYPQAGPLIAWCQGMLAKHQHYTREHLEDMPEVRDWVWTDTASSQPPAPRPT
jgi:xylulose-5-phosphate/fructose-6-phosphate phosphoketolase